MHLQNNYLKGVKVEKMKNLRVTGRRIETSEFMILMVDFGPHPFPVFSAKLCLCLVCLFYIVLQGKWKLLVHLFICVC
jgi:hypothetical protein